MKKLTALSLLTIPLCFALLAGVAAASAPTIPSNVLLVPSDRSSSTSFLQNGLLSLGIPIVDVLIRCGEGPPTLAQLQPYDVVVTWTNCNPVDPGGWGDVLADYVDGGGAVIISTFAWFEPSFHIEGRIFDPGYSPFVSNGDGDAGFGSLGTFDSSHPIMQGVTSISANNRDGVGVDSTATVVARWTDGRPLVGINQICSVAGITLYPGSFRSGNVELLYFNAVNTVFTGCVLDNDGDGVLDGDDACPDTVIPEAVPTSPAGLNPNHWAVTDDDEPFDFDTVTKGKGKGPNRSYTVEGTAGCSCEQIIAELGLGDGHSKHGCSISAMDDWIEFFVNPQ